MKTNIKKMQCIIQQKSLKVMNKLQKTKWNVLKVIIIINWNNLLLIIKTTNTKLKTD